MSYVIEKRVGNGYRCMCCMQDWDREPEWCDTLEEALTHLPVIPPTGEFDPIKVTIKDGSDGGLIAWGTLSWPQGVGRGRNYLYSRWQGDRPDTGPFDIIEDSGGTSVTDRTWDQILAELQQQYAHEKIREAEANLSKAQQDLAAAQARIKE